eukprot:s1151_g8.t1
MESLLKAVLVGMSLKKAVAGSLKKAGSMSLLKAVLFLGFFLGPVEGHPNFPWWNVRFFDGVFYLINHVSGWQEELEAWQVASLEEAFHQDPEMQIYIMGHSQMGSGSTNYAPIWNQQASQWLLSTAEAGPNQQAGQMLDLELLYYREDWAPDPGSGSRTMGRGTPPTSTSEPLGSVPADGKGKESAVVREPAKAVERPKAKSRVAAIKEEEDDDEEDEEPEKAKHKKRKKGERRAESLKRLRIQMMTWMKGLTKAMTKSLTEDLGVGQHQWLLKQLPEPVEGCGFEPGKRLCRLEPGERLFAVQCTELPT